MVYEIEKKNIYKLPQTSLPPIKHLIGVVRVWGLHVFITCVFYKRLMDNYIDL
jgi:hypothetical protein